MKSNTVALRLRKDIWVRYSAEAQVQGVTLGSYLRQRLEKEDQIDGELAALRRAIERNASGSRSGGNDGSERPSGVLVEVLLLLRTLAGPQKATVAQKEVERRGLETWR